MKLLRIYGLCQVVLICLCNIPVGTSVDYATIKGLLTYLRDLQRFETIVTFCPAPHSIRQNATSTKEVDFGQALTEDFGVPFIVWGRQRGVKLENIIGTVNIAVICMESMNDKILNLVDSTLECIHEMPTVFFFNGRAGQRPSTNEIQDFFEWCWRIKFLSVFLAYQTDGGSEVYSYTPFPDINVINVTDFRNINNLPDLYSRTRNVFGYTFKVIHDEVPPIVLFNKYDNESYSISGYAGSIYSEYIKYINGSIKVLPQRSYKYDSVYVDTLLRISRGEIEIGLYPLSNEYEFANYTVGSFNIETTKTCIIVPVKKKIDQFVAKIGSSIWGAWGLVYVLMVLIKYMNNGTWNLAFHLLNTFRLNLCQSLPTTEYTKLHTSYKLYYFNASLFAICMMTIYIGNLTSILTADLLGPQIVSVSDFLHSDLKIMLTQYCADLYFGGKHFPRALNSRLLIVDQRTVDGRIKELNMSYAYVVTSSQMQLINMKQRHLTHPRFRIAGDEMCTGTSFLRFPIQRDSPFRFSMAEFAQRTHQTGLMDAWKRRGMRQAVNRKFMADFVDTHNVWRPLCLEHNVLTLWFCLGLMLIAAVCFCCEHLIFYLKCRKRVREC